jgi:hypothetical protein
MTLLWDVTMNSIAKCLTYDTTDFLTLDRFEKLMNPLVDPLDLAHGNESYN